MKNKFLYFFAFALSFSACSKTNDTSLPPIVTPDPVITFNINLSYTPLTNPVSFELIISSLSGSVLLDTIATTGTVISASVKSKDTLVDLTTVFYLTSTATYMVQTYKGVNPSNWDMLLFRDIYNTQVPAATKTNAHIKYINLPKFNLPFSLPLFSATASGSVSASYGTTEFNIDYQRHPSGITYLVIPDKLLYKFYTSKSDNETVDLTQMDTAVKMNFTHPAQYALTSIILTGIVDSTDLTKTVNLWDYPPSNYTGADILYPKKQVQQYQLTIAGLDNAKKNNVSAFSFGSTLPPTVPLFLDESYYSITKNQFADFAVNFLNNSPAYYKTIWEKTGISWTIYASPGTTLQPESLVKSFNSQLLKNTNLGNLTLSSFQFEFTPLLNYKSYLEYALTTKANRPRMVYSSAKFTKRF